MLGILVEYFEQGFNIFLETSNDVSKSRDGSILFHGLNSQFIRALEQVQRDEVSLSYKTGLMSISTSSYVMYGKDASINLSM